MLMNDVFGNLFYDVAKDIKKDLDFERRVFRTDIAEGEDSYELSAELPGYKKEDILIKLDEGMLSIEASSSDEEEALSEKYIRREIYRGKASRNFYVGKEVKKEDISAGFADGILKVSIRKPIPELKSEEDKLIAIG